MTSPYRQDNHHIASSRKLDQLSSLVQVISASEVSSVEMIGESFVSATMTDGGVSLRSEADGLWVVIPAGSDFESKEAYTCFGA